MKLLTTIIVGIFISSCNYKHTENKKEEFKKELDQLQNQQVEKLASLAEYGYNIAENDTINLTSDVYSGNSQTTVMKIKKQIAADQELLLTLLTLLKIQKLKSTKYANLEIQKLEERANRIKERRLISTEAHFLDGDCQPSYK